MKDQHSTRTLRTTDANLAGSRPWLLPMTIAALGLVALAFAPGPTSGEQMRRAAPPAVATPWAATPEALPAPAGDIDARVGYEDNHPPSF